MKITMGGNPITLIGNRLNVGDEAYNFKALKQDLTEFKLEDHKDKIIVLTTFPSIDTGICALQAKRFNQEAANFSENVLLITISNDLPFALSRYCADNGIKNAITLSDHKDLDFSLNYGILIEELRLLARTVYIIKNGKIEYIEILPEIKAEPNYEKALEVLKTLI